MSWRTVGIIIAVMLLPLVAVFVPNRINHPDPKRQAMLACVANLKQIEGAKLTWALENHKMTNDIPSDADLFGELRYVREKSFCPAGGIYIVGRIAEKPSCSIPGHTI